MNFNSMWRHKVIITVFTKFCRHPNIVFLLLQILGHQYDKFFLYPSLCNYERYWFFVTFNSLSIVLSVSRWSLKSKLLHSLHQFRFGGYFQLSTMWVIFSILSALLNMCELFKCSCFEESLILLSCSLQFMFQGGYFPALQKL